MSWETIIPFLRPIEGLLRDPEISDILVNGASGVFIEKFGEMKCVPGVSLAEKSLQVAVRNIARALGDEINEEKPLLDARLPDGSRVAAVFPPGLSTTCQEVGPLCKGGAHSPRCPSHHPTAPSPEFAGRERRWSDHEEPGRRNRRGRPHFRPG